MDNNQLSFAFGAGMIVSGILSFIVYKFGTRNDVERAAHHAAENAAYETYQKVLKEYQASHKAK